VSSNATQTITARSRGDTAAQSELQLPVTLGHPSRHLGYARRPAVD
jgi:hypothetical protein